MAMRNYWEAISDTDKDSRLAVQSGYWDHVAGMLGSFTEPFITEPTLREPFGLAYRSAHNTAIRGASDAHTDLWSEGSGSRLAQPPKSRSDFLFVYQVVLTGIIELKCWWKVTAAELEAVRESMFVFTYQG
jgi:hypothetical protein